MLVVGYNDADSCWIVKNSWGTWFAAQGFVRVAYGQAWLEDESWTGVRNTNPDPWSKRRQHNGVVFESGNGAAHQNREVFLRRGLDIMQLWQEAGSGPWTIAGAVRSIDEWRTFGPDALDCPTVIQSSFNRNIELLYRCQQNRLRHAYFDQASQQWFNGHLAGPTDPIGMPGFVQGNRGAPGDFEIVVLTRLGSLEHWTKHNGSPWTQPPGSWRLRAYIASTGIAAAGPGLVSSRLGLGSELEQEKGDLHYVCSAGQQIRHYRCASSGGAWTLLDSFGAGPYSAPCMIESLNANGNELGAGSLEAFVEVAGHIEHWTRPPPVGGAVSAWALAATFGTDVRRVIGAVQGSTSIFEVCVERTDDRYEMYARPGANYWVPGGILP